MPTSLWICNIMCVPVSVGVCGGVLYVCVVVITAFFLSCSLENLQERGEFTCELMREVVCVCACVRACVRACVCVCARVRSCMCTCVHAYMRICKHTKLFTQTQTCVYIGVGL